jgi:3-oxoacyl-[acyl-carrier-protein] synthase-1
VAVETKLIKSEGINLGEGLASAIEAASRGLKLPGEAVDMVICDINGERFRSEEWGFALLRCPEVARDPAYQAPSDCWGDIGAASGPLFVALAVQEWARGCAAGPRALLWASSEGGLRAALVLESPALA